MKKIILFLFILPNFVYSQFKLVVEPTYEIKIRTSIELMRETDAGVFCLFSDYCTEIKVGDDSLNNNFKDGVIFIPLKLISHTSLNNIALWLARQSYDMRLKEVNPLLTQKKKQELLAEYEVSFKKKLPREYGTSFKDRIRRFVDKINSDPYNKLD
jgi:uncharacterized protein YnzC (UPF0291/DUF896 family)